MHNDVHGCDTIRFRFKAGNYRIQGAEVSSSMVLAIDDASRAKPEKKSDILSGKEYAAAQMGLLLKNSAEIQTFSFAKVTEEYGGVRGIPDISLHKLAQWYGFVDWWTDGTRLVVGWGKMDGGPYIPGLHTNWFSRQEPDRPIRGNVKNSKPNEH